MSEQAKKSIKLYKGGKPAVIEQLLSMQLDSVVVELKKEFGTGNLDELAIKLSIGK